jgi:hypothetical protein
MAAVVPDLRGFAPGARWTTHGTDRPRLFRSPSPTGQLLVLEIDRGRRFRFQLTGERIEADLRLEARGRERTLAVLAVDGPWLIGLSRSYPRKALTRLHALIQTAAEPL